MTNGRSEVEKGAMAEKRRSTSASSERGARAATTRKTAGRKSSRKRVPAQSSPYEETPVISGRFWLGALAVLPMYLPFTPLNNVLKPPEPVPEKSQVWAIGKKVRLGVTLITADYDRLACAHSKELDGAHCEFKTEREPWPRDPSQPVDDNKAHIIQPYRTFPNNELLFIQGLWAEPTVATRLHEEPSTLPEKKQSRFVVECDITFVGKLEKPKMRWQSGQSWVSDKVAWVGRPSGCTLVK